MRTDENQKLRRAKHNAKKTLAALLQVGVLYVTLQMHSLAASNQPPATPSNHICHKPKKKTKSKSKPLPEATIKVKRSQSFLLLLLFLP